MGIGNLQHLVEIKLAQEKFIINGDVYIIKELSAGDFKTYQKSIFSFINGKKIVNTEKLMTSLVEVCLYDGNGESLIFGEEKNKVLLNSVPHAIVSDIFEIASHLNHMDVAADEEDELKN